MTKTNDVKEAAKEAISGDELKKITDRADDLMKIEKTKSGVIRALVAEGIPVATVAKAMGIHYAHAYTVANTPLKGRPKKKEAGKKSSRTSEVAIEAIEALASV